MNKIESGLVSLNNNPIYERQHHPVDSWELGDHTRINAATVGTPCLRYLVRQPDGHRDVDDFDSGRYSFGAFGFRNEIGGNIIQHRRQRPALGSMPLVAYHPENEAGAFGMDFMGVAVPGLYNFEVLDIFQQKLTLVGVAHLHLHTPDFPGAAIVSFNADGTLNYLEMKQGSRRDHDSVLLHKDKIEFKVGSHLTGIKRKDKFKFGVPKWAFSEDISAKVTVDLATNGNDIHVKHNLSTNTSDLRFGHPQSPGQFSNRSIGTEVDVSVGSRGQRKVNLGITAESSVVGETALQFETSPNYVSLIMQSTQGKQSRLTADTTLFTTLSDDLEVLPLGHPELLDMDTFADYSEYLYLRFHKILSDINKPSKEGSSRH